MPKRVPSGMDWEEHRQLGSLLKRLAVRAVEYQPGNRKQNDLYANVRIIARDSRSELSAHLAQDCPEYSAQERDAVYYGPDDPDGKYVGDIHAALKDAREKILATNPKSKAIAHINMLLDIGWPLFRD